MSVVKIIVPGDGEPCPRCGVPMRVSVDMVADDPDLIPVQPWPKLPLMR